MRVFPKKNVIKKLVSLRDNINSLRKSNYVNFQLSTLSKQSHARLNFSKWDELIRKHVSTLVYDYIMQNTVKNGERRTSATFRRKHKKW